eukprot:scaffold29857_cov48-Prasinocladus_malaysianus.AAC.2
MMWEALRDAIDEEMEMDPKVCIMVSHASICQPCIVTENMLYTGEDVGHYGGSYKVSYDLYKKFGDLRRMEMCIGNYAPPLAVASVLVDQVPPD